VRVIAGRLKGRRLLTPTWTGLRPTSDRLRETLFNVLGARVIDARVLDLFAGTGALGLEALSRGADRVVFVERDARAVALVSENVRRCGAEEGCAIIRAAALMGLKTLRRRADFTPFDIVLLDPPYDESPRSALVGVDEILAPGGLVVVEHARRQTTPDQSGPLHKHRELVSGDSALSFYALDETTGP
jgi:16S rRNA (guanine(966)-N(2))-methyltransferase RsmD